MSAPDLKPCPFCGGEAHIEQIGDRRQSTIYCCNSCGCRLETGEEWDHGRNWNTRAPLAEALAVMADATLYGTGIMQDGKRIDPQDFFASPDPAAPTGHWKDVCRESNGPEICDEPCSKCLRAIGCDA